MKEGVSCWVLIVATATLIWTSAGTGLPLPPARGYRVVLETEEGSAAAHAAAGYGRRDLRVAAGRMADATTARGGLVTALATDLCVSRAQSCVQLNATGVAATARATGRVWPPAPVFGARGAAWARTATAAPCPRTPSARCDVYTTTGALRNVTAYYRHGTATPVAAAISSAAFGTHWVRVRLWDPWPPVLELPYMCLNAFNQDMTTSENDDDDSKQEQQQHQEQEQRSSSNEEEETATPPLFPCLSHTLISAGSKDTVLFTEEVWTGERTWRADYTAAVTLGVLQRLSADERTTYRGDLAQLYTAARATNSCRVTALAPDAPPPRPALFGVDVAAAAWTHERDPECACASYSAARDCDVYRAPATLRTPGLTLCFEHDTRALVGGTVNIAGLALPVAVEAADTAAAPDATLFVPDAAVCGTVPEPPAVSDAFFARCAAYCAAPNPERPADVVPESGLPIESEDDSVVDGEGSIGAPSPSSLQPSSFNSDGASSLTTSALAVTITIALLLCL